MTRKKGITENVIAGKAIIENSITGNVITAKPSLKTASSKTAVRKKGIPKQHYCRKQHNKSDIIFRHNNKESLKWS